jgi:hypothetical protein
MKNRVNSRKPSKNNDYRSNSLPKNSDSPKIIEAQGWIIDANGDVILVAQALTLNPIPMFSCHAR